MSRPDVVGHDSIKAELLASEVGRWTTVYVSHTKVGDATHINFSVDVDAKDVLRHVEAAFFKHVSAIAVMSFDPESGSLPPDIHRFLAACHQQRIDVRFGAVP